MASSAPESVPPLRALLEPMTVGRTSLRNRVFVAPHTTNFGQPGSNLVTGQHVAYLRARAHGGAGLVITEGIRVHPTSLRRLGLGAFSDEAIPGLEGLVDAIHAEGAAAFAQMLHTGRHVGDARAGTWAPSAIPWATGEPIPHVMNREDIAILVDAYRQAAGRLARAGFDGVEVHLGHGHLLQQFLSPATNQRSDEFGGSLDNRLRLARRVLGAVVEAAIRDQLTVGIRISAEEFLPDGLDLEAMVEVVRRLLDELPLDFVHVSHSAYIGEYSLATQMADMSFPSAPFIRLPAAFKRAFPDVAILAVCRLDDLTTAAGVLERGAADLVGFARPHIADPAFLRKTQEGLATEVRSCIACNQGCNGNLEQALPITCVVNPEVGLEREWAAVPAVPAGDAMRVLVIGGGPAGLEAAVTARRRGHDVTLVDAGERLGGQVRIAASMRGRERFALLVDELEDAARRLRIVVRAGAALTGAQALEGEWDAIVLATGARPASMPLAGSTPVWSVPEALADESGLGGHVLVYDEDGGWAASGLAEHLAAQGRRVDLVTPLASYAWRITVYSRLALRERFGRLGVQVRPLRALAGVDDAGNVVLQDTISGTKEDIAGVSAIVHAAPGVADDGLLDDLRDGGFPGEVHLIGDAYAPRTCLEAVYEGRLAGTALGLADHPALHALSLRPPYRSLHNPTDEEAMHETVLR